MGPKRNRSARGVGSGPARGGLGRFAYHSDGSQVAGVAYVAYKEAGRIKWETATGVRLQGALCLGYWTDPSIAC